MKTHRYWLVVLLMMLTGLGVLGSGTGYADPNTGSFEVPEVKEDFEEFEHKPDAQKEQPVNETQVQTEEKRILGPNEGSSQRRLAVVGQCRFGLYGLGERNRRGLLGSV